MRASTTLAHRESRLGAAPRAGSTPNSPQRQQHVVAVLAPHDTARPKAARPASGGWGLLASLQSAWSQRAPQQPAQRVEELVQQVCLLCVRPLEPAWAAPGQPHRSTAAWHAEWHWRSGVGGTP